MRFSETDFGYVIRLESGEEILSSVSAFAKARGIGSATIQGIGAASGITLGYFDRANRAYVKRSLDGEYELLSLTGNVSYFEGAPWVHIHAVVAGADFVAKGGHLFSANVTVTAELTLSVSRARIERTEDPATGFRGLVLAKSLES